MVKHEESNSIEPLLKTILNQVEPSYSFTSFFVKIILQAMQTKSCYVVNFLRDDLTSQFPDALM